MSDQDSTNRRYERIRENAKRYGERMSDAERQRYRELVPPPGPPPKDSAPTRDKSAK